MLTLPDTDYTVIAIKTIVWTTGPKYRDLKPNVQRGWQARIAAKDATTVSHESWKINWNCGKETLDKRDR